jgi:hypothetical protein
MPFILNGLDVVYHGSAKEAYLQNFTVAQKIWTAACAKDIRSAGFVGRSNVNEESLRYSAGMGKRKCLFVNGCECSSPVYTATEFVDSYHNGAYVGDYFNFHTAHFLFYVHK